MLLCEFCVKQHGNTTRIDMCVSVKSSADQLDRPSTTEASAVGSTVVAVALDTSAATQSQK